jgi:hypothetical protein
MRSQILFQPGDTSWPAGDYRRCVVQSRERVAYGRLRRRFFSPTQGS